MKELCIASAAGPDSVCLSAYSGSDLSVKLGTYVIMSAEVTRES